VQALLKQRFFFADNTNEGWTVSTLASTSSGVSFNRLADASYHFRRIDASAAVAKRPPQLCMA
jgi:hypothetical protein